MSQSTGQEQGQVKVVKCPNCNQKYTLPIGQLESMRELQQKVRCKKCGLLNNARDFIDDLTAHPPEPAKPQPDPEKPPEQTKSEEPQVNFSETTHMPMPAIMDPQPGQGPLKEYKVLTLKDKVFGGKFEPERLEFALNTWAVQGWKVVSISAVPVTALTRQEEVVIVMERDKAL
jgi:hypothetical protein